MKNECYICQPQGQGQYQRSKVEFVSIPYFMDPCSGSENIYLTYVYVNEETWRARLQLPYSKVVFKLMNEMSQRLHV